MSLEQRQQLVDDIDQARSEGARLKEACATVEIDAATYRRWQENGVVVADRRKAAIRPTPLNKLTEQERQMILLTCHLPHFQSLPPSQIVPTLADSGRYLGSESSFYRVLREHGEQNERGRAKARSKRAKPDEYKASGPNQCWCWDVTWRTPGIRGEQDAQIGSRV